MTPRVKICGVTRPEEAIWAVELGADFIGLNFHPPSPRYVEPERAAEIADAVRGRARVVGVFVNRPTGEIEAIDRRVGLDDVQLHGDEKPAQLRPFAGRAIRALRVEDDVPPGIFAGWDDAWALLLDARHPDLYGGSGRRWNYASLAKLDRSKPIFLAGGLGPDNVRAAIAAAKPWGVDVCSGVEATPGRKDRALLERLMKEIHDGPSPPPT